MSKNGTRRPPVPVTDFAVPRHASGKTDAQLYAEAESLLLRTPTGRDLVEGLRGQEYRVSFDAARTAALGSDGFCDVSTREIVLKPGVDLPSLALLLAHEAVHALQHARAPGLFPSTAQRPEVSFRLVFAHEADAYAQQVQVAFELARAQPAYATPLLRMREKFPQLCQAADRALRQDAAALDDGRVVAAAFSAFYDDARLRAYYEQMHLSWLQDIAGRRAPAVESSRNKKSAAARQAFNDNAPGLKVLFHEDVADADFRRLPVWRGSSYLERHLPDMDPRSARFSGLSAGVHKALMTFYATWLPGRPLPEVPVFGLYLASRGGTRPSQARQMQKPAAPVRAPKTRKINFW